MDDVDLEVLIRKDRMTPLPAAPDTGRTLAAVRARARSEMPEAARSERQTWALTASAGAAAACTLALLLASRMSPLLLAVPAVQLMALQVLVKKEAENV